MISTSERHSLKALVRFEQQKYAKHCVRQQVFHEDRVSIRVAMILDTAILHPLVRIHIDQLRSNLAYDYF